MIDVMFCANISQAIISTIASHIPMSSIVVHSVRVPCGSLEKPQAADRKFAVCDIVCDSDRRQDDKKRRESRL